MTIRLHIKSKLNKLGLQVITTLLNNTCNLEMTSGDKNFKYGFIVDLKIKMESNTIEFRRRHHMWDEFVVGCLLCSEGFFFRVLRFSTLPNLYLSPFLDTGLPRRNVHERDSGPMRGAIPTKSHNGIPTQSHNS